ncbi:trypsin-like peptidase domain-containing protein [Formosa algae]|uniref:Do/DeqQ family serine protease n=1 Tax=Formosa algae TaxID=225843 RepID=A0A9X1C904_9FLAO|nr:trypsin-like peptidase domain-containing protein [Formosa algae]MBP1840241.1 Do/DeqQ family serine protease [Formosa algae]MDQ0335841.1 Do/DeqQ family serine protease [Formosa algae]OEI80946.1 serine protease [Formosa algae]PNW26164.1 serine protease [Formosa algae]
MKKILTLVFVSALGGLLTLGAYKMFLENEDALVITKTESRPSNFLPTTNVANTNMINNAPDFTTAAENTVHSVVHVKNTSIVSGQMTYKDLFLGRSSARPQVGTGSGVIISPDGYIITNNHVINNSQELTVTLNDNREYNATIIGSDDKTDIALLKIDTEEDLPYTTFGDSDQAKLGEWVLAVGNPFNLTSTVTAGIISAKSRDLTGDSYQSFIQTDAAVNPGNSGGALVNANGDLIGINTAISSQTGSYIGYSFAVPSNIARKVIEDIMEYGNVQNGILGVTGGALNNAFAEKLNIDDTEGFYVDNVEEGSGAQVSGIEKGDIIKKVDQVKIRKFADLRGHLNTKRPDDVVNVTILRDGDLKEIPVTLIRNQTFTMPLVGVIKNTDKKDLKKFNLDNGVKIIRLNDEYAQYWKQNGIMEGTIITAINTQKVNSIDDVQTILKNKSPYEPLQIELINANGEKERYNFR